MHVSRTPTVFVLSVLTALVLVFTLVLARGGARRAEAGTGGQEINIHVSDNLKNTLLPNTCWIVSVFGTGTVVDVVSDNNAKPAVCDSQLPRKADLTDSDTTDGNLRILIPASVITANGNLYLVHQKQAPLDFSVNTNFYLCNLSAVKCEVTATDVFKGEPNIDGLWNITLSGAIPCSVVIVQSKGTAGNDLITMIGTCTGLVPPTFNLTGTVGGGQISASGTIDGCAGTASMSGPVSWNGNRMSGNWMACGGTIFGGVTGTRKPTSQEINITVHNNVATGDLLGGTCWQVFYAAFGKNIPVDNVSDNNAKAAACDNLNPNLADLVDKDAGATGTIRITISAALRGTYGDQWHVQQFQTASGYLPDSTKYACDLSMGKCTVSSVNVYDPAGDSDGDGCSNVRELQTAVGSQTSGGRRDPKNFWDYAQMPTNAGVRNNRVRIDDISAVVLRYHQDEPNGAITRFSDPLLTAIPPSGYHPAFDRTYVGPNPWNLGPPNGKIRIDDISFVVQQYHHDCA